jgi:TolA-binding protein
MNTEHDIELVEKYFDQDLTEAEVQIVTERLETDVEFKALFDQEKVLIRSIRGAGLHRDLAKLKELEKSLQDTERESTKPMMSLKVWHYAIAAAVALFLIVTLVLLPDQESPEQLFQTYFAPARNVFEPTVRGADPAVRRAAAFQAYEWGNYQFAVEQFTSLLKENKEPGMLLLNGNANLMLGNVEAAEENFITLINDFDELDTTAEWYLSLCYLKKGEVDKARNMLKELGAAEGSYAMKARELLKKIG